MKSLGIRSEDIGEDALAIVSTLAKAGYGSWVVGGCVRDLLLGEKPKDFDVATTARPDEVLKLFRRSRKIGRRFTIVHVISPSPRGKRRTMPQQFTEVVTLRGAPRRMDRSGKILDDNRWSRRLEDDVVRRDFSINALYLDPVKKQLLDFTGGVEDMRARCLRVVGEPNLRFREDPVRILRLVRFQVRYDFEVGDSELAAVRACAGGLSRVDPARMQVETEKMLLFGRAAPTVAALEKLELMDYLVPGWSEVDARGVGCDVRELRAKALEHADNKVQEGRRAYWGDLLAIVLWPAYCRATVGARGTTQVDERAATVLQRQRQQVSVYRREQDDMLDSWRLQKMLQRGKVPAGLLRKSSFPLALRLAQLRRQAGDTALKDFNYQTWMGKHRAARKDNPPRKRGQGKSQSGRRGRRQVARD